MTGKTCIFSVHPTPTPPLRGGMACMKRSPGLSCGEGMHTLHEALDPSPSPLGRY